MQSKQIVQMDIDKPRLLEAALLNLRLHVSTAYIA